MKHRLLIAAILLVPLVSATVAGLIYLQHVRQVRADRDRHSVTLYVRDHQGQTHPHQLDVRLPDAVLKAQIREVIDGLFRADGPVDKDGATGVFWIEFGPPATTTNVGQGTTQASVKMSMKVKSAPLRLLIGAPDADFRCRLESEDGPDRWIDWSAVTATNGKTPGNLRDEAVRNLLGDVESWRLVVSGEWLRGPDATAAKR